MKVVTLLENTTISKEYSCNHGLSLYIETANHKILFDTGSNEFFIDNAKKLGVKLEEVDVVIISHGHYDYGGGLEAFLKINSIANIYMGKEAFDKHIVKVFKLFKYDIGLKKDLQNNKRIITVDGRLDIDNELILFNHIMGDKLFPKGNNKLLQQDANGNIMKDDFEHEINLIIHEENHCNLICGCAHKGIINIIELAKELAESDIKTVIGGFHLMGNNPKVNEDAQYLNQLAKELLHNNVNEYYTGHCTGEMGFNYLNQMMHNIKEIKTGMVLEQL